MRVSGTRVPRARPTPRRGVVRGSRPASSPDWTPLAASSSPADDDRRATTPTAAGSASSPPPSNSDSPEKHKKALFGMFI